MMIEKIVAPSAIPKAEKHPAMIQKSFAVMIQVSIFTPLSSYRISIMLPLPCITVFPVWIFQDRKVPECEPGQSFRDIQMSLSLCMCPPARAWIHFLSCDVLRYAIATCTNSAFVFIKVQSS